MGSGTVLFMIKFKLCLLLRFWDPRHRNKISNIADVQFKAKSFNLNNIRNFQKQ